MNTGLRTIQLSYARNGHVLFQDLELELKPGQGLLVCGANGAGKTSLLRVLAGLISPTEGSLTWKGKDLSQARLAYHQDLHFLGHQAGVKNKLTVRENLCYSQDLADHSGDEKELATLLQTVQLRPQQDYLAQQLSAGQKRRLALARLLASPKPLWILDEPFTNLDQNCQQWFCERLENHLQNQGMVILASHQPLHLKTTGLFQTLSLPLGLRGSPYNG